LFTGSRYTGLLLEFIDFVFEQSFGTTQNATEKKIQQNKNVKTHIYSMGTANETKIIWK